MLATDIAGIYPEDYIHYSAENVDLSSLNRITSQTKKQILQRSTLSGLRQRKRLRKKRLINLQGMDAKEAEALFNGDMFRPLNEINVTGETVRLADMSIPQAIGILNNLDPKLNSISAFCTQAQAIINQYLSDKNLKNMFDSYASQILEAYAAKTGFSGGAVAKGIIADLLGRSNEKFFRVIGQENGLGTAVTKMLAAVAALQDPPNNFGTMTVAHNNSGIKTQVSGSKILEELILKFNKWANYQNNVTAETSFALMTLKGNREILERLDKNSINVNDTIGGKNFKVSKRFQPDNQIKKLLSQVDGALKRATSYKRSKADVSYYIDENGVRTDVGVNVKNYKEKISPTLDRYDIRIQSGTPLLTMLVRESALSGARMNEIYNLAAVHGDSASLNSQWDQMIEYVKYKSLLNTLAGFTGPEETYYISVNGNMWTMEDFIMHLINSDSIVRWSEIQEDKTGGLSRTPYVRTNVWRGPRYRNPYKAISRSGAVQKRISNIMYSTKIGVDIQLSELAALFKFVL